MKYSGTGEDILRQVAGRPVVIWGARMTGIGFARFAKTNSLEVSAFIDSDPALQGSKVNGIAVHKPNYLQDLQEQKKPFILVVAVALKADEIKTKLSKYGLKESDVVVYSDYCDLFYTIDIVGTCNLKCASCVHSIEDHGMPKGIMSLDTFKSVIAKIKSESRLFTHVSLYNWGEPFMHPNLPEIIDHLHENGVAAAVSSNLSVRFKDRLDSTMRAAPDILKVSISGYYPEAYNATHGGGDINLVKSNMYRLRYLMDKYGSNTYVDVNYHLYRDNNGKNLQKMQELCQELGFALSTVQALVMPLERAIDYCEGKPSADTIALSKNLLVDIGEGIKASSVVKSEGCPFRDNQININFDLNVPVCCTVSDRLTATVNRNYLTATLPEISHGKENAKICTKCMSFGLPEYNLGYNKKGWDEIAATKTSLDVA
jgi:molybdenum cofactor biosynthesis enzyme MoaA